MSIPIEHTLKLSQSGDNLSSTKDPRLNRTQIARNRIIAQAYNLDTGKHSGRAATTKPVSPLELATKPVHKPAMERISRRQQLNLRASAGTSALASTTNNTTDLPAKPDLQGMFCSAKPNKKPKGSRNIPTLLAKQTTVPAECWPLLQAHEKTCNMWTSSQASLPGPSKADLAAILELVEPVSPLHESVNIVGQKLSLHQDSNTQTQSLEICKPKDTLVSSTCPVTLTPSPSSTPIGNAVALTAPRNPIYRVRLLILHPHPVNQLRYLPRATRINC